MQKNRAWEPIILSVATLLIAGNAYFVKRLVDQLDHTAGQVELLREDMSVVKFRLGIQEHAATRGIHFKPGEKTWQSRQSK